MFAPDRPSVRILPLIALLAFAAPAAAAPRAPSPAPQPFSCDEPVVLRSVAAGLHFRGSVPDGYRPTETGLRNPETGEELPIEVAPQGEDAAVLRVEETRIEMTGIRRTGTTDDGWTCAADFTVDRGDRTVRGEARYTVSVSGLEFRVSGSVDVEGMQIDF